MPQIKWLIWRSSLPEHFKIFKQVAHKFNVKSALLYCDNFLAQNADEDESFLQLQTVHAFCWL